MSASTVAALSGAQCMAMRAGRALAPINWSVGDLAPSASIPDAVHVPSISRARISPPPVMTAPAIVPIAAGDPQPTPALASRWA